MPRCENSVHPDRLLAPPLLLPQIQKHLRSDHHKPIPPSPRPTAFPARSTGLSHRPRPRACQQASEKAHYHHREGRAFSERPIRSINHSGPSTGPVIVPPFAIHHLSIHPPELVSPPFPQPSHNSPPLVPPSSATLPLHPNKLRAKRIRLSNNSPFQSSGRFVIYGDPAQLIDREKQMKLREFSFHRCR